MEPSGRRNGQFALEEDLCADKSLADDTGRVNGGVNNGGRLPGGENALVEDKGRALLEGRGDVAQRDRLGAAGEVGAGGNERTFHRPDETADEAMVVLAHPHPAFRDDLPRETLERG